MPPCLKGRRSGSDGKGGGGTAAAAAAAGRRWQLSEPLASIPGLMPLLNWCGDNLIGPPPGDGPQWHVEYYVVEEKPPRRIDQLALPLRPRQKGESPNALSARGRMRGAFESHLRGDVSPRADDIGDAVLSGRPSPEKRSRFESSRSSSYYSRALEIPPHGAQQQTSPADRLHTSGSWYSYADSVAAADGYAPEGEAADAITCVSASAASRALSPEREGGEEPPARVVSISVAQWTSAPPRMEDWVQVHGLLSAGSTPGGGSKKGGGRVLSGAADGESPPRLVEISGGGGTSPATEKKAAQLVLAGALVNQHKPRNAKRRPTPAELWALYNRKEEPIKRKPPPRLKGPPPVVRMRVPIFQRKKPPPPPPPIPPPPPPLPPYAGAIPRTHPGPRGRSNSPRRRLLPSEIAKQPEKKPAPLVCFTNTRCAGKAPRPSQLEPHMQLPQRIQFFLRSRISGGLSTHTIPDSKYILTATVQPGYEHAGPSFLLDEHTVRHKVLGVGADVEPYLTGELFLEVVVPSTEKINPGTHMAHTANSSASSSTSAFPSSSSHLSIPSPSIPPQVSSQQQH